MNLHIISQFRQGSLSIQAGMAENLTKVVRDNARIMSLDKANSKLLVEIKKLHVPEPEHNTVGGP